MMKISSTYRAIAGIVALTLMSFSVGLPVVLQWCPSSKSTSGCACDTGCCAPVAPAPHGLTSLTEVTCCTPIAAGEKNPNEFLQQKSACGESGKNSPVLLVWTALTASPLQPRLSLTGGAPPASARYDDISLMTSSLLI